MRCCYIEMLGDDGEIHYTTVEAASLFDAAEQAISKWAMLSWFNPNAGLTVRSGSESWTVSQKYVRSRKGKARTD